eukprot:TRINITY_DN572_c0_g1_i1.p1 TRINITY_DN572_c0_g1~~TRINITY_DN572_c0_g1_i1.p1  ORF type:complete len:234 (-),score=74.08 TRINITY_DN572_c0_g1_i1:157-858(-)
MAIKDKLSHVVEAVTDKVATHSSSHNSVNTASKTPAAYPAGATHPLPGEKSINGATDKGSMKYETTGPVGSHKDHPSKTPLGGGGKHDVGAKEHLENEMTGKDAGTKTAAVRTGKTTPVVPVVPVAAVKPVATTPVSAKAVDVDAYAVASAKTTPVEGTTHPVGESDGLRDVKFYLSMGGRATRWPSRAAGTAGRRRWTARRATARCCTSSRVCTRTSTCSTATGLTTRRLRP